MPEIYISFVFIFLKELEAVDGDSTITAKRKARCKDSYNVKTPEFVRNVPKITDKNPRKSINVIATKPNVSRHFVGIILNRDLCSMPYK